MNLKRAIFSLFLLWPHVALCGQFPDGFKADTLNEFWYGLYTNGPGHTQPKASATRLVNWLGDEKPGSLVTPGGTAAKPMTEPGLPACSS